MKTKKCFRLSGLALAGLLVAPLASAGDTDYLGQIVCGAWNFAPRGTALAAGQILPISQNTALFSLLGTTYGGNGQSTFALPDLQGRVMIHAGQGPGLANYDQGEVGGAESQTLLLNQLPAHTHQVVPRGSSADASLMSPSGNVPSNKSRMLSYSGATAGASMASSQTSSAGQGLPVNNMQPFVTVTCVIATQGVFPARP